MPLLLSVTEKSVDRELGRCGLASRSAHDRARAGDRKWQSHCSSATHACTGLGMNLPGVRLPRELRASCSGSRGPRAAWFVSQTYTFRHKHTQGVSLPVKSGWAGDVLADLRTHCTPWVHGAAPDSPQAHHIGASRLSGPHVTC